MTKCPVQWQIHILHSQSCCFAVDVAHSCTNKLITKVLKPHVSPFIMDAVWLDRLQLKRTKTSVGCLKSFRVLKASTDSCEWWISFQRKAKMRSWISSRRRAREELGREMMGKTQEDPSDHVPSSPRSRDVHSRHPSRFLPNPAEKWDQFPPSLEHHLSIEVICDSEKIKWVFMRWCLK